MIYYNRRILIVDDDLTLLRTLQLFFKDRYQVFVATSARQAMTILENETIQIVLLDILLPDQNGIDLLSEIKNLSPETSVIMLTAVRDVQEVVRAMKAGASHYITKDFDGEELCIMMDRILKNLNRERALVSLKGELESIHNKEMIMGNSPACSGLRDLIYKIADLPSTVLIQGESGTGKELFARAIHLASKNKEAPFITLNLASVPKHLVESELFGHEKGSFTGATHQRLGKCELAHGGVLFLDEVGEIEPDVQVKLLRFLQEGEFERVGGNRVIQVKVRVLAATNRNLHQAIRDGKFRDDFFYRLNVIPAIMPPLRERREEIPNLVSLFLERYCRRFGRNAVGISDPAMKALCNYHWPGNVRELEHLIERLVATNQTEVIGIQDVPMDYLVGSMNVIGHNVSRTNGVENNSVLDDKSGYYKRATSLFEKNLIRRVLQKTGGNRRKTAKELGIPLSTLKFRMQKLEMYVE